MSGIHHQTLARTDGLAYLRQRIGDVLTTPVGSRVMRRDYGSRLPDLVDRPITPALTLDLYAATIDAIQRWVPDFRVQRVWREPPQPASPGQVRLRLEGEWVPQGAVVLEGLTIGGPAPALPLVAPLRAQAGPDLVVGEGETVTLRDAVVDHGVLVQHAWTQRSGPTVQLHEAQTPHASFVTPVQLVAAVHYAFTLTVTDTRGRTANDVVRVTVQAGPNDSPLVEAGPAQRVAAADQVVLPAAATDAEGEALHYAWTQTAGPPVTLASPDATGQTAFVAPAVTTVTALTFELTVTDARGGQGTDTVQVVVVPRNVTLYYRVPQGSGSWTWLDVAVGVAQHVAVVAAVGQQVMFLVPTGYVAGSIVGPAGEELASWNRTGTPDSAQYYTSPVLTAANPTYAITLEEAG